MSEEQIISAGIDIGTSTTQLIFSRLTVKNTAGFGRIPQTEIVKKDIFYRSRIYFTPLLGPDQIDGEGVRKILETEYETARLKPSDISTGALIITGESLQKKNARSVAEALSSLAGEFVVAAAGPDLESILAGKGSGAGELSHKTGLRTVNLDIGGGTSNLCCFTDGEVIDTACLDIGGRLVKLEDRKISYIAPKMQILSKKYGLSLKTGDFPDIPVLSALTDRLADVLAQAVGLIPPTEDLEFLKTNRLLSGDEKPELLIFSGGVASCMASETDVFAYNDIGVLLARSIRRHPAFASVRQARALETMRATVIGAGNYSMNISGSTIEYTVRDFPVKNLPIAKIRLACPSDIPRIGSSLSQAFERFGEGGKNGDLAVAFTGLRCPSFPQIQQMAAEFMAGFDRCLPPENKCILIMEADIGKALGQALKRVNKNHRPILCIDNIRCETGDYIDLGAPIASGTVIPVVVKTLVFKGEP